MPTNKGLWSQPEFRKLWIGETVSLLGSQVTLLALLLTASVILQASPLQMGVLGASQAIPFVLFGLVAGVWVEAGVAEPADLALRALVDQAAGHVSATVASVVRTGRSMSCCCCRTIPTRTAHESR